MATTTLPVRGQKQAPPAPAQVRARKRRAVNSIPSADLVGMAAGMLSPIRLQGGTLAEAFRLEPRTGAASGRTWVRSGERVTLERVQWSVTVAPGVISVSRTDPAARERAAERLRDTARRDADLRAADLLLDHRLDGADAELAEAVEAGDFDAAERIGAQADHLAERLRRVEGTAGDQDSARVIAVWSRKSRARMVRTLAELDYSPLFGDDRTAVMVTLTYPGDWLDVAPNSAACTRHVRLLQLRYKREFGEQMRAVWKREFQRRGAPHYHLLMVPPVETSKGEPFRRWLARVWSEIVGHPDPITRQRHLLAGTRVERAGFTTNPQQIAVYFSKHGVFAAKDYQNHAPAEWVAGGESVGRFWGYWGLERVAVKVELSPVEALSVGRTLRRWQRANGFRQEVRVPRRRYDTATGEAKHKRGCDNEVCLGCIWWRTSGVRRGTYMAGPAGFAVVGDGAAVISQMARWLDAVREEAWDTEVQQWLNSPARLRHIDKRQGALIPWGHDEHTDTGTGNDD